MEDVGSIFGSVNSSAGEPAPGHLSSPPTTGEAAPLPPGPALEDMIAHGQGGDSAVPIDIGWHPFHGPECDSCITLGNITHSGERFITRLSLHGSAEILHHAILLLYEFTENISEDRFITYLSSMDSESVGVFLANYRNCRVLDGYKVIYDDCQPLYDVHFTQVDNSDGHTILEVREFNSTPDIALVGDKSMEVFHVASTGPSEPDPILTKDAESMGAESVGGFLANYRDCHVLDGYKNLYDDCQPLYDAPFTQVNSSDGHTTLEVREFNYTPDITLVGDKSMDVFHAPNTGPNEPDPNHTNDAESGGGFLANYRNCHVLDGYKNLYDDCQPLYDVPFTQVDNSDGHTILEVREFNSTPDIALVGDKSMEVFHVANTGTNEPDPIPTKDAESMDVESVGGFLANYRDCHVLDGYRILYDDCQPLYDVPFTQVDSSDGHTILEVREINSTPAITLVGDKSMDVFHVTNTEPNELDPNPSKSAQLEIYPTEESNYLASHEYPNEMHQFHSITSAQGPSKMGEDGEARTPTFGISQQRQRIMKMAFSDVSQYFNLPMNQAAQKLQICPSALKKVCRRFNINRWPYRKVASEKRWSVIFNTNGDTPPDTVHDPSIETGL